MLADRTDAIDPGRTDATQHTRQNLARIVLGDAPALGADARSGEDLAARIMHLAAVAVTMHAGCAAAMRRSQSDPSASVGRTEVRR